MHRVSGHREPDPRSRRFLLILVPVVVLAVVGVLLGRSFLGSSDTASADCSTLIADPDKVVSRMARPSLPPLIS